MKRFDLYGSHTSSAKEVAKLLAERLGQTFVEHESSYLGVNFRFALGDEELLIQANAPDDEGYLPEPDFERWITLVYASGSNRWDTLEREFLRSGLDPLRSQTR